MEAANIRHHKFEGRTDHTVVVAFTKAERLVGQVSKTAVTIPKPVFSTAFYGGQSAK